MSHQAPQPINSFVKLLRQYDSLKVSLASLEVFKNMDYFANYMWRKCKDNKMGKYKVIRVGNAHLIHMLDDGPPINQDEQNHHDANIGMGQLLFIKLQQKTQAQNVNNDDELQQFEEMSEHS